MPSASNGGQEERFFLTMEDGSTMRLILRNVRVLRSWVLNTADGWQHYERESNEVNVEAKRAEKNDQEQVQNKRTRCRESSQARSGGNLPPEMPAILLSFSRQIAAGMDYLAGKSFVHRDLAARNILVSENDICKIADFGLSRDLENEDCYVSHGGKIPVKWTAPEALNYRKYSTASDVWSYGVLLYEIWAMGIKPFCDCTNNEALQKVRKGYRLPPPPGCPKQVYELMIKCWHPEPDFRPAFCDLLLLLQRPDFQLLRWSEEDEVTFSKKARTLGGPQEDGEELYTELQTVFSKSGSSATFQVPNILFHVLDQ